MMNPEVFSFDNEEKLVVILESHEYIDGSVTVALVDGLVELATDRDFLLPSESTKAPFDLALWIDFTSRVLVEQLQESPVFGNVDPEKLRYTLNLASVAPNTSLYDFKSKFPFELGKYVPFFGDKVWQRRSNEMDSLNFLSIPIDSEETMRRFLKINFENVEQLNSNQLQIKSTRDAQILVELNPEHSRALLV
jgi:hypothetical protein